MFIHAWSGCDTTSATFGPGEVQLLSKMEKCPEIRRLAGVISTVTSTVSEIGAAGQELFCFFYGENTTSDLTVLRQRRFQNMIAACRKLDPQRLPPTNRAALFHSLRVHLQTVRWALLDESALDPTDYGWQESAGDLSPIMTDLAPAPECILQFIRCKCKAEPKCTNTRCSCKINGLKCVDACSGCYGNDCQNKDAVTINANIESDNESY